LPHTFIWSHIIHIHIIPAVHVHYSCSLRNLMSAVGQFPFLFRGDGDMCVCHEYVSESTSSFLCTFMVAGLHHV